MAEPHELTVAEAAARMTGRTLSPVELTEALLRRIGALEPRLQAWVTLTAERALAQARAAEREIAAKGPRSPLHGVPYGAKDIIDTAGIPTEAGSRVFAGRVPATDAHVIRLLDRAGGVLLGKTQTTEFASGDPAPSVNPWNRAHTPAGSSAGSGVAVAARMIPAALGTQTGGSVLRPAAYNGVVGLKPTQGRVGRCGVVPLSWSLDHVGVLTRTVEDAALLLQVIAGHDPADPGSVDAVVPDFVGPLRAFERAPRVGVLRGFFEEESEPEAWAAFRRAVERLARAGAAVETVETGLDFRLVVQSSRVVMSTETAHYHWPWFAEKRDLYQPKIRALIEEGLRQGAVEYLRARELQRQARAQAVEAMAGFDVLVTPTASGPAPRDLTATGDARFQSPWSFTGLPSLSLPMGLRPMACRWGCSSRRGRSTRRGCWRWRTGRNARWAWA